MAELADAPDLGSGPARGGGSSPPFRTNHLLSLKGLVTSEQINSLAQSALPRPRGKRSVLAKVSLGAIRRGVLRRARWLGTVGPGANRSFAMQVLVVGPPLLVSVKATFRAKS